MLDVLDREPLVLKTPAPVVHLISFDASSILHRARFWIQHFPMDEVIADRVRTGIYYAFKRENIDIPYPTAVEYGAELQTPGPDPAAIKTVEDLLAGTDLFGLLSVEDRQALAAASPLRLFGADEAIVRQGDAGYSAFVVCDGRGSCKPGPGRCRAGCARPRAVFRRDVAADRRSAHRVGPCRRRLHGRRDHVGRVSRVRDESAGAGGTHRRRHRRAARRASRALGRRSPMHRRPNRPRAWWRECARFFTCSAQCKMRNAKYEMRSARSPAGYTPASSFCISHFALALRQLTTATGTRRCCRTRRRPRTPGSPGRSRARRRRGRRPCTARASRSGCCSRGRRRDTSLWRRGS